MTVTLGPLLVDAGIDPASAIVIRHAFAREHEHSGLRGTGADSTDVWDRGREPNHHARARLVPVPHRP